MFNYGNIGDILKIMKFSLGLQIPKTLEAIYDMEADDYSMLFPNNGNFTGLEKLGWVFNSKYTEKRSKYYI